MVNDGTKRQPLAAPSLSIQALNIFREVAMSIVRLLFILGVLISGAALSLITAMSPLWLVVAVTAVLSAKNAKKTYRQITSHGTARWAEISDLERAGMVSGKSGLTVGRMSVARPAFQDGVKGLFNLRIKAAEACERFMLSMCKLQPPVALVRLANAVHVLVTAPTGAGKGVSLVVPFLRNSPDSAVVLDFKGENYRLTADARRAMGHKVVVIDPFKVVTQTPDQFNVLDEIEADSPLAIDDARSLAEAWSSGPAASLICIGKTVRNCGFLPWRRR